jgi:hypothetical protein
VKPFPEVLEGVTGGVTPPCDQHGRGQCMF